MKLYNTLSGKNEEFRPLNPAVVTYYSCGPTVYDYAHIGHARTYIFADILERVLRFNGFKVKRVMNITDVGHLTSDADSGEDKMEKGAKREKKSVWQIAEFYTNDFYEMLKLLNIRRPENITKATEYIPQMISLIKELEKKGFTYKTGDGLYFDTSRLTDYGKLTGKSFKDLVSSLKAGIRVEQVEGKKNITDFALWKFTPFRVIRQMEWESPWGKGFPGWHIECSAMAMAILGETIDIHTGGVDHIPIHHTNEIAQSEAATGKPFVRFWLHAGHLTVEGEKMSKSLGNFIRVAELAAKGYQPLALRYLFLTASYRREMNFTLAAFEGAQAAYLNLREIMAILKDSSRKAGRENLSVGKAVKAGNFRQAFTEAVSDDLNLAKALAVTWETVKSNLSPGDKYELLLSFDEVLGLDLKSAENDLQKAIPDNIRELVMKRQKLRAEKKFAEADEVREKIEKSGFEVIDTEKGTSVKKK